MLSTLTDDPQFNGSEVSLSNILMIGLLPSNNRIVIFSKTEKKFILRQTHKGSYIYGVHMEEGWERGLKICNVFADIFCFSTKDLLFIFVGGGGWESRNRSFFVDVTNA